MSDTYTEAREGGITELLEAESSYINDLQILVDLLHVGLRPYLSQQDQCTIFGNIEDILAPSLDLLHTLQQLKADGYLYVDRVGDVLLKRALNLGAYVSYGANYPEAIGLLQRREAGNPHLERALEEASKLAFIPRFGLKHLLSRPISRVARYHLILGYIAEYTPPGQDRDLINEAIALMRDTIVRMDKGFRESQTRERLRELCSNMWVGAERVDLAHLTEYLGQRKVVKEGTVFKARSSQKLKMVLCNDIVFLLTQGHKLYVPPISLHNLHLRQGEDGLSFSLILPGMEGDEVHLKAEVNKERIEWIMALSKGINDAADARKAAAHNG
ncbi:hypothetical protein CspHIS471_0305040 [Cutaneotrichosporon sp. HIS471]|nr:hypothetical protein CspHIS471_0305040 [Cutaneotrichosporon sp. HIS471]